MEGNKGVFMNRQQASRSQSPHAFIQLPPLDPHVQPGLFGEPGVVGLPFLRRIRSSILNVRRNCGISLWISLRDIYQTLRQPCPTIRVSKYYTHVLRNARPCPSSKMKHVLVHFSAFRLSHLSGLKPSASSPNTPWQ